MKKRYTIIAIVIIMVGIGFILPKNKSKTFKVDGVNYAVSVNGSSVSSFPTKGMYRVDVVCENAEGHWNYDDWKLIIDKIKGNVSCEVDFTTVTKTYLNNYVTSLVGTTQGNGQVVNELGIRYQGKDPNNYVWFNNELWQIVGVFDSASHGVSGLNLVKLIRYDALSTLMFDKDRKTDYSVSSLKTILNNYYYQSTNGSSTAYCVASYRTENSVTQTVMGNCDYTTNGIKSTYRGMIKNATWYLGPLTSVANGVYTSERSNASTTTAYIGAIYASDYAYASLESECPRTSYLMNYSSNGCGKNNWLRANSDGYWIITISNYNNSTQVNHVGYSGAVNNGTNNGEDVRPSIYLNENVYVLDGDGSYNNPYIIGM